MQIYRRARHGWCAAANRSRSAALSGDGRCAFPGWVVVVGFLRRCARRYTSVLGAPRDTP